MRDIVDITSERLSSDERRGAANMAEAELERMKEWKDRFAGETCVVMGNGPSRLDVPVDWLNAHKTWAVNYAHLDKRPINPTFYLVGDLGVCLADELQDHWYPTLERFKDVPKFYPSPGMDAFGWGDKTVYRYWRRSLGRQYSWRGGIDPTEPHPDLGMRYSTVTQAAAMLANYMGFTKIVFVGLDGIHPERTEIEHFYPLDATRMRILATVKRGTISMADALNEPWRVGTYNEVISGMAKKWDEGFRLLQEKLPAKLYNASTQTTYTSIERVDYRDF